MPEEKEQNDWTYLEKVVDDTWKVRNPDGQTGYLNIGTQNFSPIQDAKIAMENEAANLIGPTAPGPDSNIEPNESTIINTITGLLENPFVENMLNTSLGSKLRSAYEGAQYTAGAETDLEGNVSYPPGSPERVYENAKQRFRNFQRTNPEYQKRTEDFPSFTEYHDEKENFLQRHKVEDYINNNVKDFIVDLNEQANQAISNLPQLLSSLLNFSNEEEKIQNRKSDDMKYNTTKKLQDRKQAGGY
jgi:hypothetical protein